MLKFLIYVEPFTIACIFGSFVMFIYPNKNIEACRGKLCGLYIP